MGTGLGLPDLHACPHMLPSSALGPGAGGRGEGSSETFGPEEKVAFSSAAGGMYPLIRTCRSCLLPSLGDGLKWTRAQRESFSRLLSLGSSFGAVPSPATPYLRQWRSRTKAVCVEHGAFWRTSFPALYHPWSASLTYFLSHPSLSTWATGSWIPETRVHTAPSPRKGDSQQGEDESSRAACPQPRPRS